MQHYLRYSTLILLILLTLVALVVHQVGWYKTFTIKLDNTYDIVGTSDIYQGGATTIEVERTTDYVAFKCDILAQYQWPYCELKINLVGKDKDGKYLYSQGLDFSDYTEIFLNLEYEGPDPDRVRIYLRNYNPSYTDLDNDENSMKINELEYAPNQVAGGQFIPLADFNVASWWTRLREVPAKYQGNEYTNVPLIEIASAGLAEYGEMKVTVKEISFRHLYISKENLLFSIIGMWLGASFIYLITTMSLYRIRLSRAKAKQSRLLEIMHTLKLEKSEIDKMAKRDALTGLRNRAGLSKHIVECELELTENQVPFSIIFIDIDFFKQVNDNYGHAVGDDILVSFAQVIYNNIRIADKLGRWGGEEFILICKNSQLEPSAVIAEKICQIIEKHTFPENIKLTASFGVAQMEIAESTRDFFDRADKALYAAKNNGRNQVQVSRNRLNRETII